MNFEGWYGRGSMWTVIGHGWIGHEPMECSAYIRFADFCEMERGKRFPVSVRVSNGDIEWSCNVGRSSGKRCLCFLTVVYSEIWLVCAIVKPLIKHLIFLCVRCTTCYTLKSEWMHVFAPGRTHNRIRSLRLTASCQWGNVGKGSRQHRFLISG